MKVAEKCLIDSAGNIIQNNFAGTGTEKKLSTDYFSQTPLQFIQEQIDKISKDPVYRQALIAAFEEQTQQLFAETLPANVPAIPAVEHQSIGELPNERTPFLRQHSRQGDRSHDQQYNTVKCTTM